LHSIELVDENKEKEKDLFRNKYEKIKGRTPTIKKDPKQKQKIEFLNYESKPIVSEVKRLKDSFFNTSPKFNHYKN